VSERGRHRRFGRRHLERRTTRDERVPLSDDDREMEHSWCNIPVPPTADGDWFIIDSSSDRKTVWGAGATSRTTCRRRPNEHPPT
jgi:hypothetical protein